MIYPYHFMFPYIDWHWHMLGKAVARYGDIEIDHWDDGYERDHRNYLKEMGMTSSEYRSWTHRRQAGTGGIL